MLTALQVWILKRLGRGRWPAEKACPYTHKSKLAVQLGQGFFEEIAGKIVIDFGCGEGAEAVEMAQRGAKRFSEVAGGLNQMTTKRFIRLVEASPLRFASFELAPIRKLRLLHNRLTREFTTSAVRCQLVKR